MTLIGRTLYRIRIGGTQNSICLENSEDHLHMNYWVTCFGKNKTCPELACFLLSRLGFLFHCFLYFHLHTSLPSQPLLFYFEEVNKDISCEYFPQQTLPSCMDRILMPFVLYIIPIVLGPKLGYFCLNNPLQTFVALHKFDYIYTVPRILLNHTDIQHIRPPWEYCLLQNPFHWPEKAE